MQKENIGWISKTNSPAYSTSQRSASAVRQDEQDIEEFIRRLKKYTDVQELTREMCLELIEYITVDEFVRYSSAPREIHIYYKLLDKPLNDRRNLFIDEA